MLSALQAALLTFLVLTLPAVAAYVATSADPSNSGVGWFRSVGVGSALFLLGHGVPAQVGAVVVSLVPLGVTALALFVCYASARRSGLATWLSYGAGVGTYALVTVLVALASGVTGVGLGRALVGGLLVPAVGLGAGLLRRPRRRRSGRSRDRCGHAARRRCVRAPRVASSPRRPCCWWPRSWPRCGCWRPRHRR